MTRESAWTVNLGNGGALAAGAVVPGCRRCQLDCKDGDAGRDDRCSPPCPASRLNIGRRPRCGAATSMSVEPRWWTRRPRCARRRTRSFVSSPGSMSIIAELLSQRGETASEVCAHGSRPATHEDGAFLDRVAVPVVERDRRPLPAARAAGTPDPCRRAPRQLGVAVGHRVLDRAQAAAILASGGGAAG